MIEKIEHKKAHSRADVITWKQLVMAISLIVVLASTVVYISNIAFAAENNTKNIHQLQLDNELLKTKLEATNTKLEVVISQNNQISKDIDAIKNDIREIRKEVN